jgi:hypothetical protein
MTMQVNRETYEKMIAGDIAWLTQQPRTLEREHIAVVLKESVDYTYEQSSLTTMPDHVPPDPATRTALVALAMFFDERYDKRSTLAEQARDDDPASFSEQDVIARTWQNAANLAWEMLGGRPDGSFANCEHTVKIGARELGKLLEMATRPLHVVSSMPPQGVLATFDDGLVERLRNIRARAVAENIRPDSASWDEADATGIRAILSALAAMSHELSAAAQMSPLRAGPTPPDPTDSQLEWDKVVMGISFERVLPNGDRERVDPSTITVVVDGDPRRRRLVDLEIKKDTTQ